MKLYKKIAIALCVVIATSCTLDLREDPNAVQPSQILPSLVLNSMQRNLAALFNASSGTGMTLTRMINAGGTNYLTTIRPETFNGVWSTAYSSILNDAHNLMNLAVPDKSKPLERYARHMGITRIIQAYSLVMLADMFGDVPFSQSFQGSSNFNPGVDSQADIYAKAIELLDSAKLDLVTPTTTSSPAGYQSPIAPAITDMYYGGNFGNWVKLANSLKIKIYLNLRLTQNAAAQTGIAAVVTENNFIDDQNENFVFRYATNTTNPDARHPRFVAQYPAGGGDYQANWYMWNMLYGYDAKHRNTDLGEPRTRFYFYRQVLANSTSTNEVRCLGEAVPSHYPSSTGSAIIDNTVAGRAPMGVGPKNPTQDAADVAWLRTFCLPSDRGYWGRDHVDPQGIPPDGQLRTAYGVYPTGGRFDANNGAGVTASQGQAGAGIEPMMTRSFVQFMLSEAALYMAIGGSTAKQYFVNGINFSMQDVRDWAVNGTYNTNGVTATNGEGASINTFYPLNYSGVLAAGGDVVAATTGNIASLSGTMTIDGIALNIGDRVLVKNQTTASQNGIYDVQAGAWTRSADADTQAELLNLRVRVAPNLPLYVPTFENTNGGTNWLQTATGTITVGTTNLPFASNSSWTNDVAFYVGAASAAFDASLLLPLGTDEAMNYVAREYWIALFGNGVEAYNLYRRTGKPTGMQPTITPQSLPFPRSYWYPANFANLNNTVTQKNDLTTRVFWDNTTTNLDF